MIDVNHKNTPLGYHCPLLSFATGCHGIVLLTPTTSLAQNEEKMREINVNATSLGISLILLIYIFNVRKIVVSVYDKYNIPQYYPKNVLAILFANFTT